MELPIGKHCTQTQVQRSAADLNTRFSLSPESLQSSMMIGVNAAIVAVAVVASPITVIPAMIIRKTFNGLPFVFF
jgi:hypothetical protein